ncbi:protein TRANSPARENT TESTA 9 [Citrus sinensis]|uniref:Protein TRANSPARENT TESTA 9 n=1 Tax=Citrus sinensis TaxID=2711 RepID=A0ACB8K0M9_CITSI|nr:protein TRANSPARENT TESTA 9 [Citrus sinensis]
MLVFGSGCGRRDILPVPSVVLTLPRPLRTSLETPLLGENKITAETTSGSPKPDRATAKASARIHLWISSEVPILTFNFHRKSSGSRCIASDPSHHRAHCLMLSLFDLEPKTTTTLSSRLSQFRTSFNSSSSKTSLTLYVINELRKIKVVDQHNRELVIDLLQTIVEIVTYGDRQDPFIFECFMEYQVLAEFVRILKISGNSKIEAPLLQYLSIMIQNMGSEHAICKMQVPLILMDVVTSFPLYTEILKFAQHGEKMIQTAVHALTLNIFNVSDDMVYQFVTSPPASQYFSDLVYSLREKCLRLDVLVQATDETCTKQRRKEILLESDEIVDDLYYFKDILSVGEPRLSKVVTQDLLNLLVFPILILLLQLRQSNGFYVSAVTTLYIVSYLLVVVGGKNIVNAVAGVILYPYMTPRRDAAKEEITNSSSDTHFFLNLLRDMEIMEIVGSESQKDENINGNHICGNDDVRLERNGILMYVFSDNHSLLLASLLLLLILAESKDLDYTSDSMIGLSDIQDPMNYGTSASLGVNDNVFVRVMPQTSYQQSCERLQKELDGCWFDCILDTMKDEWENCETALKEPLKSKSPSFALELAVCKQSTDGNTNSSDTAWEIMVDVVKVFILHLQLKALISKGELLEKPLLDSADSGTSNSLDIASASFGSEVYLGSGIPCRIAFSNAGIRDIYMIPAARGLSGKVILAEKHPFRSQRGVVIAIAPLAGLRPTIDEDHPTWLHLWIREFDPRSKARKSRGCNSHVSNSAVDGRWTLGFPSAKGCEIARLLILEETYKQRSFIKSLLAPLLQKNDPGNLCNEQAGRKL